MIANSVQMRLLLWWSHSLGVQLRSDGDVTIGMKVNIPEMQRPKPQGGEVLVNADRKALGPTSSRRIFKEKFSWNGHVWLARHGNAKL